MSSRKFILFFLGIFCLGALPIAIVQPSGAASEGLNAGFILPLEQPVFAAFCIMMGLLASMVGRDGPIYMSASMLSAIVIGHVMHYDMQKFHMAPYIILTSLLLVVLIAGVVVRRAELLGVLLATSIGFQLGSHSMSLLPDAATTLYFLLGVLLSVLLLIATSISLGLTLFSDDWQLGKMLRESKQLDGFRSLFR